MLTNILLKYGPLGFIWIPLWALVKWIFVWPSSRRDQDRRYMALYPSAVAAIVAVFPTVASLCDHLFSWYWLIPIWCIPPAMAAPVLVHWSRVAFRLLFVPDRSEVRAVSDVFRGKA